jgi:phenylpyruvate tautomerase PptA (4-oxalocrotonate tautomerase family)
MPLIRIDMLRGKPPKYRAALRDTIYETLRDVVGVPADDRHEVIAEYEPDNLNIAPEFFGVRRTADAILVQITINEGRTIDQKRALYVAIVAALQQRVGLRPEDVTINLLEVKKENWSFGNGIAHYVDAPAK